MKNLVLTLGKNMELTEIEKSWVEDERGLFGVSGIYDLKDYKWIDKDGKITNKPYITENKITNNDFEEIVNMFFGMDVLTVYIEDVPEKLVEIIESNKEVNEDVQNYKNDYNEALIEIENLVIKCKAKAVQIKNGAFVEIPFDILPKIFSEYLRINEGVYVKGARVANDTTDQHIPKEVKQMIQNTPFNKCLVNMPFMYQNVLSTIMVNKSVPVDKKYTVALDAFKSMYIDLVSLAFQPEEDEQVQTEQSIIQKELPIVPELINMDKMKKFELFCKNPLMVTFDHGKLSIAEIDNKVKGDELIQMYIDRVKADRNTDVMVTYLDTFGMPKDEVDVLLMLAELQGLFKVKDLERAEDGSIKLTKEQWLKIIIELGEYTTIINAREIRMLDNKDEIREYIKKGVKSND